MYLIFFLFFPSLRKGGIFTDMEVEVFETRMGCSGSCEEHGQVPS
jgi:hypothetical protein